MAVCQQCQQEMLEAPSCTPEPIELEGEIYQPIAFGSETLKFTRGVAPPERCHDCFVAIGGYHHPGCDMEQCPRCGHQLPGCDCDPLDAEQDDD